MVGVVVWFGFYSGAFMSVVFCLCIPLACVFTCTLTVAVPLPPLPLQRPLSGGLPQAYLYGGPLCPHLLLADGRAPLKGSLSVQEREENGRRHRLGGASSDDRLPPPKKIQNKIK